MDSLEYAFGYGDDEFRNFVFRIVDERQNNIENRQQKRNSQSILKRLRTGRGISDFKEELSWFQK